jgi:hypothetical protein
MIVSMRCAVMVAACALWAGKASGDMILTFEALKDDEQVQNFYNGGTGSLGSGPGPNYGISFDTNAVAVVRVNPFPNDPSPPTVLELDTLNVIDEGQTRSMTMNVSGGFTQQLNFWDIAILRAATVTIWSGTNGGGTMLAQTSLPLQSANNVSFLFESLPFEGTAHSVVFTGGDQQLALDDISFGPLTSVPEPSGWQCGLIALACFIRCRPSRRRS